MSISSPSDSFSSDLLGRRSFCETLERFLLTEHHFVDGGLVVSLDAPFGSGKTTFLQMWAADLSERRKQDPKLPRPIVINAWENDYCGDPLIAMISGLSLALEDPSAPAPEPDNAGRIREAAKDVFWFSVALANSFVSQTTGIDAVAAGEFAATKSNERQQATAQTADALHAFEQRTNALSKLKQALVAALGNDEPQAIVLIDELDRCRPDYAINYLETIKHIFDVHGIVFVLAVDERQLGSTAAALFGGQLNFPEYYRKFSHRTILLPTPDSSGTANLIFNYCARYLVKDAKRESALRTEIRSGQNIVELISAFQLRPRQIQEAFRILGHAAASPLGKKMAFTSWTFEATVLFMATLRVGDRAAYEKLGSSHITPSEINRLLQNLPVRLQSREWWFSVLVSGIPLSPEEKGAVVDEMINSGWLKPSEGESPDPSLVLSDYKQAWGRYGDEKSGLARVYAHIESLKSFAQ